jgi:hypothetical protein
VGLAVFVPIVWIAELMMDWNADEIDKILPDFVSVVPSAPTTPAADCSNIANKLAPTTSDPESVEHAQPVS